MLLPIIRIQKGSNLLNVLEAEVTEKEENLFREYQMRPKHAGSKFNVQGSIHFGSIADISSLTFAALKVKAMENLEKLEQYKVTAKENNYQEILDIISKVPHIVIFRIFAAKDFEGLFVRRIC